MVDLAPFRALLFSPDAPSVAGEARHALAELTRQDPDGSYHSAARTYHRWRREGILVPDPEPAFWILDIASATGDEQVGLVGALDLDDDVAPHEAVEPHVVAQRVARLRALPVDVSPITVYTERAVPALREIIEGVRASRAAPCIRDEDGGRVRLWRVGVDADGIDADIRRSLATMRAVVADGHHRVYAARQLTTAGAPAATLAFLIPHPPASRAVPRWLEAPRDVDLLGRLERSFTLKPLSPPAEALRRLETSPLPAVFGLHAPGDRAFLLVPRDVEALSRGLPQNRSALWRGLDQTLWDFGVAPLLAGISSVPTTDPAEALRRLRQDPDGNHRALVLFRPIPTDVVTTLALASEALPPKVTWFAPKPPTGLLLRPLDEGA